jgi:two-component sensor histidine kinase
MQLEWTERGGPPVVAPARKGFGTRLLMRSGTATDLRFDPEGVTCLIAMQL